MKTKYAKQINKYGIVTVDNRREHNCRVIKLRGYAFTDYINGMKVKLNREAFIKRCEQLELAVQHVKAVVGCRVIN